MQLLDVARVTGWPLEQISPLQEYLPKPIFSVGVDGQYLLEPWVVPAAESDDPELEIAWACLRGTVIYQQLSGHLDPRDRHTLEQSLRLIRDEARELAFESGYRLKVIKDFGWTYEVAPTYEPGDRVQVVQADRGLEDDLGRYGIVLGVLGENGEQRFKVRLDGQPLSRFYYPDQLERQDVTFVGIEAIALASMTSIQAEIDQLKEELAEVEKLPRAKGWIEEYRSAKNGKTYYRHVGGNFEKNKRIEYPNKKEVPERRRKIRAGRQHRRLTRLIDELSRRMQDWQRKFDGQRTSRLPTPGRAGEYALWDSRNGRKELPKRQFTLIVFQWEMGTKRVKRGKTYLKLRVPCDNPAAIAAAQSKAQKVLETLQRDGEAGLSRLGFP